MWHALFQLLASFLAAMWATFPLAPLNSALSLFGPHGWGVMLQWCGLFGMAIDVGTLFTLVSVLVGWRGFWLIVRIYRVILELIPMAG